MKVTCERCKSEGIRFKDNYMMSGVIHEWLCIKCFDLLTDQFYEFKENFINSKSTNDACQ